MGTRRRWPIGCRRTCHCLPSNNYPGDKLGLLGAETDLKEDYLTAILFRVDRLEQARANGQAWFGVVIPHIEN